MAIDSLSYTLKLSSNWNDSKTQTGFATGWANQNSTQKTYTYVSTNANTAVLGANEQYTQLLTITAGSTSTIDLTSFTDVVGTSASSLARVKGYKLWLLSSADLAPDGTTTGTTCTNVQVGNSVTTQTILNLGSTAVVDNGGCVAGAAGSTAGWVVDANHKIVLLTNLDAVAAAKLLVEFTGGTS